MQFFLPSCLCHVFTRLKIQCYISIKSKSVSLSLPADVRWGSVVTHSFLPRGGRNECVTTEPQRTSAGRLCFPLLWSELFFSSKFCKNGPPAWPQCRAVKKNSNNTVWGYLFWCLDSSGCFKVTVSVIGAVPLYRVLVVQFFSVKPFSWVLTWVLNTLPLLLWSISERKLKRFVNFTRTTSQLLLRK